MRVLYLLYFKFFQQQKGLRGKRLDASDVYDVQKQNPDSLNQALPSDYSNDTV